MTISFYTWFCESLQKEFEQLRLIKKSDRGMVSLIRHRSTKQRFILRSFIGNAEVYHKLLTYECSSLPKVYEIASQNNHNLVLEEYIQGDNMGEMLKDSLFTAKEVRTIVRQLCTALWVLHSLGAVHRDIKPENIVLRGSDAVLIDFDAARLYKTNNKTDTQILGTVGFAAPEQYGLSQSDVRSDIYSLGILINIMLTGCHPTKQLASGHWGRVITNCTHVNPNKRYRTVLHLLDEL